MDQKSGECMNDMVYGETGQTPICLDAKISSLRFWIRLTRMENAERLPRKAYNMVVNIHNNGKKCWASSLCMNLMMYSFGYVWINQGVQNVNWFLCVFKKRNSDCWSGKAEMTESKRATGTLSTVRSS